MSDSLGPANSSWPLDRCNLKRNARVNHYRIIDTLVAQLKAHITVQHFSSGTERSLAAKLDSSLKSYKAGQITASKNKFNAFINEVKAQSGKKMPKRIAGILTSEAREIMELLIP